MLGLQYFLFSLARLIIEIFPMLAIASKRDWEWGLNSALIGLIMLQLEI